MASPLLLEGQVDDRDAIILGLREQVRRLGEDLRTERKKSNQAEAAAKELRHILTPLHNALGMVFGEIESMGIENAAAAPSNGNPKWNSWKQKLPGRPAEMIDLLLLHENMSTKQLMAAMHCAKDTVYQAAYKLGQAGLVSNNGGRYSLRDL